MKKKSIIISLALLGIILAGILSPTSVNAQDQNVVLQFDPTGIGLKPDSNGTVSLIIENVHDLYALEFHLSFNPQFVEVVDADLTKDGIQIASTDVWKDGFIASNKVDNIAGKIDFAVTLLNPALPIAGKQTVATITLKAKDKGTSQINIDSAILSTRDAQEITTTKINGLIGVNSSGEAPDANAALTPNQVDTNAVNGISTKKNMATAAIVVFLLASGVFSYAMMRRD
ncbi:MAG: cohesin domain-containing protein [Chloroflexi bacterium]|nr:cohesin domain-containing protein [Chloroflexota bacterium]